jgi:predicted acetyltransferase
MESLTAMEGTGREELARILSHAFGFPLADAPEWFDRAGEGNVLGYHRNGALVGGLVRIPMGQYFGGKRVSTTGVAGVGVSPVARGTGVATRMMRQVVLAAHEQGASLSTLYPATVPLYQRAGYERAGSRFSISVGPRDLPRAETEGLVAAEVPDTKNEELRRLYSAFAASTHGALDRVHYMWARIDKPYKNPGQQRIFLLRGESGPEGYGVFRQNIVDGHDTEVTLADYAAHTPRAHRALLSMLGSYRSLAGKVTWYGSHVSPLVLALPERHHTIELCDYWMLRIVNVTGALEGRGYPKALRCRLALTLTDDLIDENRGGFLLEIEGGHGRVSQRDEGGLTLDVRALAALYTGFQSARALSALGALAGTAEGLEMADAIFASPPPSMVDGF